MSTKKFAWEKLRQEKLLDLRLKDLKLSIKDSRIEPFIKILYQELKDRGLKFRPHCYIADDWYSVNGVPGIAIPFFVFHPKLARLEKKFTLDVEGWSQRDCMKLLRHEAGHAIDNAFLLRKSKARQKLFGLSSKKYPDSYLPKAYSKRYVVHLNSYYAQAHPDEDWAETFAVWLNPKSNWEKRYAKWPALNKLKLLDEMMNQIKGKKQLVTNRDKIGNIANSEMTLSQYYSEKMDHYGLDKPFYLDPILPRLFSAETRFKKNKRAAQFVREERKDICKMVARWTGQYRYTINQIIQEVIDSCRLKKLHLVYSEKQTRMDLVGMLTAQTLNYIASENHRIPM